MDLSQALDYMPHDLLVAKLEAYGVHPKLFDHIFPTNNSMSALA